MKKIILILFILTLSLGCVFATRFEVISELSADGYTCILTDSNGYALEKSLGIIIPTGKISDDLDILNAYPVIGIGKDIGFEFADDTLVYIFDYTGNTERNNFFGMCKVNSNDSRTSGRIVAAHVVDGEINSDSKEELGYTIYRTLEFLIQVLSSESTQLMLVNSKTLDIQIIKIEVYEDSAKIALADLYDFIDLIY